ncbi:inositol monophosphatase family protein [Dactylosporangium sp. NPDC005572]|uniref:inositol monophosphatase family protein n=1 Tax=Dactylosporangium sp. NPDC005572 TaxID=3156889 RepID=UPI00339DE5DB
MTHSRIAAGTDDLAALTELAQALLAPAVERLSRGYARLVAAFARQPAAVPHERHRALAGAVERQAEAAMRALVLRSYPGHAVVGDTVGTAEPDACTWVLDAVDGTGAMIRTARAEALGATLPDPAPAFAVTVAVLCGDRSVVGVVGQLRPHAGGLAVARVWTGALGRHTTCDTAPVFPGSAAGVAAATLASTAPEVMFGTPRAWATFQALRDRSAAHVADQNCIGFLRLLGAGVELAVERDLDLSDAAALIPILQGAGIVVTDHDGHPVRFEPAARAGEYALLAATPALHAEALAVLRAGLGDDENDFRFQLGLHQEYTRKFRGDE